MDERALVPAGDGPVVPIPEAQLRPTSRRWILVVSLLMGLAIVFSAHMFSPLLGAALAMGAFVGFFVWIRRRTFAGLQLRRDVVVALDAGDLPTANRLGHEMMRRSPPYGPYHVLAVATWAVVELRGGHAESAARILERALASRDARGRIARALEMWWIAATCALAQAVIGEIEAAQRTLALAEAEVPASLRGLLLPTQVFLACRTGEHARALRLVDDGWPAAEPQLKPFAARQTRLMEAFAIEHMGDDYRSIDAARGPRALAQARKASVGTFAALAVHWPELQEFLQRHGLAPRAA